MTMKMVRTNPDILGLNFSGIELNFVFTSFITGKLAFMEVDIFTLVL